MKVKMVLMLLSACALMAQFTSPMKKSFMIITMSLLISIMSYTSSSSVLPSCAIILTFSSGMMVLFCCCCLMAGHEKTQNKFSKTTVLLVITSMAPTMMGATQQNLSQGGKMVWTAPPTMFMLTSVSVVVLTMVCINKAVYKPNKQMTQSY